MGEEECTQEPKPAEKSFGWPFWILLFVLVGIFVVQSLPKVIRHPTRKDPREAVYNLRRIGIALHEFENEFGEFPNENTAALINKNYPEHGFDLSGKSSNALFRQLFAAGITQSEAMFYAKIPNARKPDGDLSPGKALQKGEVAFAYVIGLSSEGNPARIVAFCPIIPGTKRFDPQPFDGKAFILRTDNTVTSVNIIKDGQGFLGGVDILSPENPIWNSKVIDIRYPE